MAYATGEAEVHPYDKKRLVLAGKTDTPNVALTDTVGSLEAFHD